MMACIARMNQNRKATTNPRARQADRSPDGRRRPSCPNAPETRIGLSTSPARSTLRDHLLTAGELLRMDQLCPDQERSQRQVPGGPPPHEVRRPARY